MKDNRFIEIQLKKHPELEPLYSKECNILSAANKSITIYLFFEYVLVDALKEALAKGNYTFIKEVFGDIEILCNENYDYYSDIVITAIFENFQIKTINEKFSDCFGNRLKSIFNRYIEG